MANSLLEKIKVVIMPVIDDLGYELWGCTFHGSGKNSLLRIYIENKANENGERNAISVDDCAKVSNEFSAVLDVADIINGYYTLEISSPGIDRLLFTQEHYQRFIGHMIAVKLTSPMIFSVENTVENLRKQRNYNGKIIEISNNNVILEINNNKSMATISIPFAYIEKANIIPEF